ncbi:rhamnosyltransferase [Anaerostipes hadrus]|uniref:Rhamnosyltransferase n=1 Tax=Anaerostipes hadrus TaxID=649756 RepID=A0A173R9Z5_ANAHA|nr:glycosyltransferase family 2 protein [Anaerostipes hadrus]CUM74723.1 rhamnosyltransferase [Anaerostipes hadrus]
MEKIFAGIVLYNPDIERLKENVDNIINQVSRVILVNNGSENTEEIEQYLDGLEKQKIIYKNLNKNKGIAAALNVIVNKCIDYNVNWVMTLDQDTVCNKDIVQKYRKYLKMDNVGQLTCEYIDRNFKNEDEKNKYGIRKISWCITSAALLNINAWKKVGGFDERLFIDEVDYDICLSMREKGYYIYQIDFIGFVHEIGEGKSKKIGNKIIKTWNHSAFRRYYSTRNAMIVARKHSEINTIRAFLGVLKHIGIILLFENDKWNKFKAGIKGLCVGIGEKI